MTAADPSYQLREAEGHSEDMAVEGEVNLILPFRHRPVCSDSKMSYTAFQNPHSFGWEQGIRAVCISKETLRKAFFVKATVHLTVCISLPLCLCSVPTLTQYPSTPIYVIFSSQSGMQPICLGGESYLILIWFSCAQTFFCHYLDTLRTPAKQGRPKRLKGKRQRNERETEASVLRLLSIEPVPL